MDKYRSNSDKILQAVLQNEDLMKYGDYDLREFSSIDVALSSSNVVVHTVAQIIDSRMRGGTESSIYKEITDYLRQNL